MAEKKQRKKKEPDYVAGQANITYELPYGVIGMLAYASGKSNKEVWVELSSICNICAYRLSKKASQMSSWTVETFPGTKVTLEIEMERQRDSWRWDPVTRQHIVIKAKKDELRCTIELGFAETETFTQSQVNDYITEKIILGDDDEEASEHIETINSDSNG